MLRGRRGGSGSHLPVVRRLVATEPAHAGSPLDRAVLGSLPHPFGALEVSMTGWKITIAT